MHRCAAIHSSMSTLTNVMHGTSEQHVDLTASRRQRDMADMQKLDAWFQTHDPFDPDVSTLRSLSTGLTAGDSDNINCDNAEVVGQMIQKKLDGVCIEVATIRRSDQVRTLECLQVGVKVDKTVIHIDPLILFTRATLLLERHDQEEQINNFKFEFTPEPSALFKNGSMRKTQKSELRNSILKPHPHVQKPNADCCVVDGGAALHHFPWVSPQCTYNDLAEQFIGYLVSRHKNYEIHVVFDGYTFDLSTKTSEQQQRQNSGKVSADVTTADGSTCVSVKKAEFLLNQSNKSLLIKLLCQRLTEHGIRNSQCDGDADGLIVETAISIANAGKL